MLPAYRVLPGVLPGVLHCTRDVTTQEQEQESGLVRGEEARDTSNVEGHSSFWGSGSGTHSQEYHTAVYTCSCRRKVVRPQEVCRIAVIT